MIAGIAGELVSKFVEKQWPNDRETVWEIIRIAVNKARQEGKWLGMTSEFYVPIYKTPAGQSYIVGPPTHPVLLAINGVGKNLTIRDESFMFHRNGYGDIRDYPGCKWNTDVYDIGESAYHDISGTDFSEGVRVGVRALGLAGNAEKIWINGTYKDGEQIYTYTKPSFGNAKGCTTCLNEADAVNGVQLDISSDFNYINNIIFSSITSITKTQTRTPIEVIIINKNNSGYPIARLGPGQRFSKYRKYLVPNDLCDRKCLHALFKIGQQELITSESDNIIISNEEALISIAKGVYMMYYKDSVEAGAGLILQGLSVLEKEKREEESPNEFPIQVSGGLSEDVPEIMKYTR